ncbi:hypothetical protein ACFQML_10275 [Salinirubellus salinus]|uniref:hypothetical protein n=1 Tax=Salinirubellus salinus TaxID=1364945 RepID=UPI003621E093
MPHPHTSVETERINPESNWTSYTESQAAKPTNRYVYTDWLDTHHKYVLQQYQRHPDTLQVERSDGEEAPSGRPGIDLEYYGRIIYNLRKQNTRFHDSVTAGDLVDVEQKAAKDPHGTYELYKHQHDSLRLFNGYYLFTMYRQPQPGVYVVPWHRPISAHRLDELLELNWNRTTHPTFGRCKRASLTATKLRRRLSRTPLSCSRNQSRLIRGSSYV